MKMVPRDGTATTMALDVKFPKVFNLRVYDWLNFVELSLY